MKPAVMIIVASLALLGVGPARPAAGDLQVAAVSTASLQANANERAEATPQDDEGAVGASTYVLLAIGLFGMGLVSRRRQPE